MKNKHKHSHEGQAAHQDRKGQGHEHHDHKHHDHSDDNAVQENNTTQENKGSWSVFVARVPGLVMVLVALYLVWLFFSGNNQYYINSGYFAFNFLMGGLLLLVASASLLIPIKGISPASLAPLVLVLMLGFLLPPQPLSSVTASNRSVNVRAAGNDQEVSPLLKVNPETLRIADWVRLQNYEADYSRFIGQRVDVIGFLFKAGGGAIYSEDNFMVGKFVITCCAIDASPLGLEIESSDLTNNFKQDDWVRVKGEWKVVEKEGQSYMVISADFMEIVPRPSSPYE
jgi:uncharacterized repeat protein (TIGR03943 family)